MLSLQGQPGSATPPPVSICRPSWQSPNPPVWGNCSSSAKQAPPQAPCKASSVNSVRAIAPSVGPDRRGGACLGGRWGLKVEAKEDGCEHVPWLFQNRAGVLWSPGLSRGRGTSSSVLEPREDS